MMKARLPRPAFTWEKGTRLFPNALKTFPGANLDSYVVNWSYASLTSTEIDGIIVLPSDPSKPGYLYHRGTWRRL